MTSSTLIIVDFDGTIYKGNSFPRWIAYCLRRGIKERKIKMIAHLVFLLLLRKALFLIDHVELKKRINVIDYPADWASDFCRKLEDNLDERVLKKIKSLSPAQIIVSTAAPKCYAQNLQYLSRIEISSVVSSDIIEGKFIDNYGPQKLTRTLRHIEQANFLLKDFIFFTDHPSDIYLAKRAAAVFLCNSNAKTRLLYESQGVPVQILGDFNANS